MSRPHSSSHDDSRRGIKRPNHHTGDASVPVETSEDNSWLFTEEEIIETPSRVQGLPQHVELKVVAKTAQFIQECGGELQVPQLTKSVAIKFFQRFFMLESMLNHPPPLVAAACLFLSCKVQETHKRLKDIIYWTVKVRTRNTKDFPDGMDLFENSPGYYEEKNNILDKEREVLRVLNFDLTVDHPYKHLWALTKSYLGSDQVQRSITQAGWNFLNDSFRTYLHVRYDAKEVATAAFFMSAKLHNHKLPDGTTRERSTGKRILAWHEFFKTNLHRVEEVCKILLDMYELEDKASSVFKNGAGVIESVPPNHPAKRRKTETVKLESTPIDNEPRTKVETYTAYR